MNEWVTPSVSSGDWPRVVRAVLHFLAEANITSVELMHGWSTSTFSSAAEFAALQWQVQVLPVVQLPRTISQRQALGFCLGQDDLFIAQPGRWEILLCHEGDLHLRTADRALAEQLERQFASAARLSADASCCWVKTG